MLILWGRVLLCCGQCWLIPEISCMAEQQFRVYGKAQLKASTKVCCPQPVSLFPCQRTGQHAGTAGSFAPSEAVLPFPDTLQIGELLVCDPGYPQTTLPTLGSLPSFPTGVLPHIPGMTLVMARTSKTSVSVLHYL